MPAWKAEKLLETRKVDQVDLAALGEATGILFESLDMLREAVSHLDRIRNEKVGNEEADLDAPETSDSQPSESKDQDKSEGKRSDDQKEKTTASTEAASAGPSVTVEAHLRPQGDTSGQRDDSASKSSSTHN